MALDWMALNVKLVDLDLYSNVSLVVHTRTSPTIIKGRTLRTGVWWLLSSLTK